MTYTVLLSWPRRSREEAAHNQKQGNGKSPSDFVELWISLRHSLLTGRLTGLSSFPAGLFSIASIIILVFLKLETLYLSVFKLRQFPVCGCQEMYTSTPQEE